MNNKIKILFISRHIVNSDVYQAGHRIFSYYLTNFCSDGNFDVGYIVLQKNNEVFNKMKAEYPNARDFSIYLPKYFRLFTYLSYNTIIRYLLALFSPKWYQLDPLQERLYKKAISKVKNSGWSPDIITFEWTDMMFLQEHSRRLFENAVFMGTEHDVTFKRLQRKYKDNFLLKTFFLERFKQCELKEVRKLDVAVVLSSDDRSLLIENGISENRVLLLAPFFERYNQPQSELKPQILYFGAMSRVDNLSAVEWFIDNVLVRFHLNQTIKFVVIGGGTPEKTLAKYKGVKNVEFKGFVDSPAEYFQTSLCMVVPLIFGSGIKIKILEAMSGSLAVITNNIGIEGINAIAGTDYLHCETPEEYNEAINKFIADPELAKQIGVNGSVMVDSNYNFEKSYNEYKDLIIKLSGKKSISFIE